jgi:hypothetical protein
MLFDPEGSKFYVLNRTMAFVWRRCDGAQTLAGLLEGLHAEFQGVDLASAEADVHKALGELVSFGLVVDSSRPDPVP